MKKRFITIFILLLVFSCAVSALATELPADGEYTIEVVLSGGSGRSYVESPAALNVKNGVGIATVIWSSPFYEYMRIGDTTYKPVQKEGNATFEIPVILDEDIVVNALTVAMGDPHEIEYVLCFDSATLRQADSGAAVFIYLVGGCVCLLAIGVIVVLMRHKNRSKSR